MISLSMYLESASAGAAEIGLDIAFILSVSFGVYVIISKNPIVSILYLIALFLVIAVYLMQLGVLFVGISYILVYVGAVSILFLFILMLINVRVSELVTDNNNGVPLSLIAISVFYLIFSSSNLSAEQTNTSDVIPSVPGKSFSYTEGIESVSGMVDSTVPHFVTTSVWESVPFQSSHISSIGNVIYTSYPILLLITSVILLLSMIGSIVITLKR